MTSIKEFFLKIYEIARYRKWAVYDPQDSFVLYIGKRSDCIKVMNEQYDGLILVAVSKDAE